MIQYLHKKQSPKSLWIILTFNKNTMKYYPHKYEIKVFHNFTDKETLNINKL